MAGYTRQSTFADGDTITAALFNNEYNQVLNAFSNTGGHKHDGTANEGPVIGIIGDAGDTNIQGEDQQKLDVYANDLFIKAMTRRNIVCGIASEEEDHFVAINSQDENHQNKYVVLIDPLLTSIKCSITDLILRVLMKS